MTAPTRYRDQAVTAIRRSAAAARPILLTPTQLDAACDAVRAPLWSERRDDGCPLALIPAPLRSGVAPGEPVLALLVEPGRHGLLEALHLVAALAAVGGPAVTAALDAALSSRIAERVPAGDVIVYLPGIGVRS